MAVAAAFGLGSRPVLDEPPFRGQLGAVWRLRTDAGVFAVKRCDFDLSDGEAEEIARFQDAVVSCGVCAPRVVRSRAGRVLADGLRVASWLEMAPASDALNPAALGAFVARLHAVPDLAIGAVYPHLLAPVTSADWTALVADARAAGAPFAESLAAHVPALLDAASLVRPPAVERTCHRDLFADNVRLGPEGTIAVFDFDSSGPGDPSYELGMVMWEFARGSPSRAAALHSSYVVAGGPGRITSLASFSMIICISAFLLHRSARHWIDHPEQRPSRAHEVHLWLTDPCTRPVLRELLDAVGPPT